MHFFTGLLALLIAVCSSSIFAQQSYPVNEHCRVDVSSVEAVKTTALENIPDHGWVTVRLPEMWTTRWKNYSGRVWYRVLWQPMCDPGYTLQEPVVLAVSHVNSAGAVYLNGDLLWANNHLEEPLSKSWNMPRYWILPIAGLKQGVNETRIFVNGFSYQNPGVGELTFNNVQRNYEQHQSRVWNRRTMFLINIILSATLGIFCLVIWMFRRQDFTFALFALSTFFWILFISSVLRTEVFPFPSSLLDAQSTISFFIIYTFVFCLYMIRFVEVRLPKIERSMALLTVGTVLLVFSTNINTASQIIVAVFMLYVFLFFCVYVFVAYVSLKSRKLEHILLTVCLSIIVVISCIDLGLLGLVNVESPKPLMPYTSPVITLFIVIILATRLTRNIQRVEGFNLELEEKIESVSAVLKSSMTEKHMLELENVRLQERIHLSHDLHDGLGASIVRSMIMVDQNERNYSNQQFLSMLKLLRDDLRQIIDSGSSAGVKVPENPQLWIVPVRHRFVQLMDEMDIHTQWQFPSEWKTEPTALQCLTLIRVQEEALTNILKHSHARNVRVVMELPSEKLLTLSIHDDGIGFNVVSVLQHGMSIGIRSMQMRLLRIGAELKLASETGQTTIQIILPL